ncbi:MAG: hypothetical protein CL678_09140 [Bdellovibrionaceae bacterium]|nr:hypothetical protein [Pseudobdellovibrionaceae bacterium]|tara:strand:+ start:40 stop:1125 length:1086 start_codon:yes stop_codon:yes gene_type:complete
MKSIWRAWTIQLYSEFDDLCYQYRLKDFKKPTIEIAQLSSIWGDYDSSTKMIRLSERLFNDYPWHWVMEVFKHELAHHYSETVFKKSDGHGPYFQKACEKLGVYSLFRRAQIDLENKPLPEWRSESKREEENALYNKIEKLLSLAQSSNEHESALAMKKVREIYQKYHIKKIEKQIKSDYVFSVIHFKTKRFERHIKMIASIVQNYFFVEVIYSHQYDPKTQNSYKTIELLGTRENVLMSEYVFHFLRKTLDSLWRGQKKTGVIAKRSFFEGVLVGFEEKLKLQNKELETNHLNQSLIVLKNDPILTEFTKERFPRVSYQFSSTRRRFDVQSYESGHNKGKNLSIYRPIDKKDSSEIKYLK